MASGPDASSLDTAPHDSIAHALRDCLRHPRETLIDIWSWKTSVTSALLRALIFWFTNRKLGYRTALTAMAVEAVFAVFASGLLGAMTQRLRDARPLWATALTVWLGMPLVMLAAQAGVHEAFHTPHQQVGLACSFVFAAVASGFTWYAMRRGVLLQGEGDDSLAHDATRMPRVVWEFVLWPVRRR
jgi:hypothetical protein